MFSFLRRKKKNQTEEPSEVLNQDAIETVQDKDSTQEDATPAPIDTRHKARQAEPAPAEPVLEIPEEPDEQTVEAVTKTILTEPDTTVAIDCTENKKNKEKLNTDATPTPTISPKEGFFTRLKKGLSKTRRSFTDSLASLVLGRKEIDDDLLEALEMILLTADVGIDATDRIITNLTEQVTRKELKDPETLITALKVQLQNILNPISMPLDIDTHLAHNTGPFVILMVGINGVGKTTTIGKLAKKFQQEGKSVMLAAGDTFRAAAVEQLQTWGERNNVPVVAQKTGADSAAVLFDAMQSAKAKKIDVLIADTAGRLHTQSNLMEELKKVVRVMSKVDDSAPHEVMLVIDAGTGQNALNQAEQFKKAVGVSGITLTKLDGTAKGGIVFALAEQSQIPIRFIGVGESIDDLRPFDQTAFTEALFDQKT